MLYFNLCTLKLDTLKLSTLKPMYFENVYLENVYFKRIVLSNPTIMLSFNLAVNIPKFNTSVESLHSLVSHDITRKKVMLLFNKLTNCLANLSINSTNL